MEDVQTLVIDALRQLGIEARPPIDDNVDRAIDLILDPWGIGLGIEVKRWALVTDETVGRLVRSRRNHRVQPSDASAPVLFVVGDRITQAARDAILANRWGFYDLRGRIALRSEQMLISADVDTVTHRSERTSALGGKAGLEVATALLMNPDRKPAVRELARELDRSASTVSEVMSSLRGEKLIAADNRVIDERLFWTVAEQWPTTRTYLSETPRPGLGLAVTQSLRLGLEDVGSSVGWALTDTAAAAVYGAPVAVRSEQVLDFYVPDATLLRRASALLHVMNSPTEAACSLRVAPVPMVCRHRLEPPSNYFEWPTAHPLFVALDLAQDVGRGREILSDWTPSGMWSRVW